MRRLTVGLLCALMLTLPVTTPSLAGPDDGIYFDDSQSDFLVLGNSYYEVRFRKSNGGITTIIDKANGGSVTLGSRWECLWGASFEGGSPDYVGGCHYSSTGPARFTYAWQPETHTLTLTYTPDPTKLHQAEAQVQVRPSTQRWFDMHLSITNHWGRVLREALFPSDLVFSEPDIKEAILPILPGVSLDLSFFAQDQSYTVKYPGWPGVFADLVYIRTTGGELAIYSLPEPQPARVRPTYLGFIHDEEYMADSTIYHHTFGIRLEDGGTWDSPWVRFLVGASSFDTALAFREDTGLDQFPSLREKLGTLYARVSRSPLYKADTVQLGQRFADYSALFDAIPDPGILHPVAYQPRRHDENYPDFLPPDPHWGTTADMAAMFRDAQARGFLVMPYTNPTWWDDESPTLAPVLQGIVPGTTITDVAAIDAQGRPITETYDGIHFGYVVSPWAPFVQDRLALLNHEMTVDLPSDFVFEDQIGARAWLYDYNRYAPDHLAYMDGWLAHTQAYSPTLLMTEMGYDRLAATEIGFHGSVLLPEMTEDLPAWRLVPWAPLMLRDKVLFYQHDLAPQTFTYNKAVLGWNLAMGYMLSYDLFASEYGGGPKSDWLGIVGAFQRDVLSRYADAPVTGFATLQAGDDGPIATQTVFGACSALVNWDETRPFPTGAYILPARGALVQCEPGPGIEGGLTAGVFTSYNGQELSPDDHYLIEERSRTGTVVRQLRGTDTPLVVTYPMGVPVGQIVLAEAYATDGRLLATTPTTQTSRGLLFEYHNRIDDQRVDHYWLPGWSKLYVPLVLRN